MTKNSDKGKYATILVIFIILVAVAWIINNYGCQGSCLPHNTTSFPPTTLPSVSSQVNKSIFYESTSESGVGEFNLSLSVPSGYAFTNQTAYKYTFCPVVFKIINYGGSASVGVTVLKPFLSSRGVPYCSLEFPISTNESKMFESIAMIEVYNASGVNFTSGMNNRNISYTINNTYNSWLSIVSLICNNGPLCNLSTPSGCEIVQNATFQYDNYTIGGHGNSSVIVEACSKQKPGRYTLTVNSLQTETGTSDFVALYHSGS